MTNSEIRTEAQKRRKRAVGLLPISFAMVGFLAVTQFATRRTQSLDPWTGIILYALLMAANGLVMAGCAYAGCAAWKTGRVEFNDLFAPVTGARRFARTMAPVLIMVALTLAQRYVLSFVPEEGISAVSYAWRIGSLVLSFAAAVVFTLYYTLALWPDAGLVYVFGRGLKLALGAFWRFFGMSTTILFLPLLGVGILGNAWTMVAQSEAPSLFALIAIIITVAGTLAFVAWRVMPYYFLANAGLAIEVFGEGPHGRPRDGRNGK